MTDGSQKPLRDQEEPEWMHRNDQCCLSAASTFESTLQGLQITVHREEEPYINCFRTRQYY